MKKMMIFLPIFLMIGHLTVICAISGPGGKLIVGVGSEPTSMDPSLVVSSADYVVTDNWTECLISKDPSGDLKPGLATSWKISPDGKRIEFELRKGVKFHSGDPLTAKDVEFSFERGKAKNTTARTRLNKVEKVEILDDYHLIIHFSAPDVSFIPNRAGGIAIVSKSYYERVGEDQFVKNPIGTSGPYKFVHYVPGEYVDIERFEDYWGEKRSVKEARFYFVIEDSTRVAKLKAGEVDIINNCPYPSVRDVEKSPDLKIIRFPANHPTPSVIFSTRNPKTPWHDRRVRLAMAYAIDCNTIIKNVLHGIPNRWAFLAPYELGYDPNLKPYPYDPKKAKDLLAEAGYPKGFDLKLYWPITSYFPMVRETIEAIASYFEAIGIRSKLVAEDYLPSVARRRASKGPDAEYVGYAGVGRAGGVEPSYTLDLFFGGEGGFSSYYNPELDKVIADARATVDDVKRGELIRKGVKIVHEEVASIPIFNMIPVFALKKNVDFKPTQKNLHDLILVKDITLK
jgi:peptide/nickel transport system substrate-binding protein